MSLESLPVSFTSTLCCNHNPFDQATKMGATASGSGPVENDDVQRLKSQALRGFIAQYPVE
jgi:hypothetical protein